MNELQSWLNFTYWNLYCLIGCNGYFLQKLDQFLNSKTKLQKYYLPNTSLWHLQAI